jgi:hypothetical protein
MDRRWDDSHDTASLLRLAHLVITRRVMCERLLKPHKQEVCQLRFVSPGDRPNFSGPHCILNLMATRDA